MTHEFKTIDRTAELKNLRNTYPAVAQAAAGIWETHQLVVIPKTKEFYTMATARAADLGRHWEKLHSDDAAFKEFCKLPGMRYEHCDREIRGDKAEFYGSTSEQYAKELRGESQTMQQRLNKAREELEKTGIKEALTEGEAFKKRRRRYFSEHDGDWSYDRRFDTAPFQATKSIRKEFPVVELIIPISNSAGISSESISQFGARCLALAEVLESAGYRVAITGESWGITRSPSASQTKEHFGKLVGVNVGDGWHIAGECWRVIMREANDYGDVQSMALFGSAEFYRRTFFPLAYQMTHWAHGYDEKTRKKPVGEGYGPVIYERPIATEAHQLALTPDLMGQIFTSPPEKARETFEHRILWQTRSEAAVAAAKAAG